MRGLIQKLLDFLRGPQGRKYVDRAKDFARDPRSRAKVREGLQRMFGGRDRRSR